MGGAALQVVVLPDSELLQHFMSVILRLNIQRPMFKSSHGSFGIKTQWFLSGKLKYKVAMEK